MYGQNRQKYSLNEIKDVVYNDSVNTSNLIDILTSLSDFDFNNEVREILDKLADNTNISESVRYALRTFIEEHNKIVETEEERIEKEPLEEQENSTESSEQSDANNDSSTSDSGNKEVLIVDPFETGKSVLLENIPTEQKNENKPILETVNIEKNLHTKDGLNSNVSLISDDEIKLTNELVLNNLIKYASSRKLKILSKDPGVSNYPEISIELTEDSKPYIDNLLLTLHDNKDDINVSLTRIEATGKEVLTLKIDDPKLSQSMLQQKGKAMFATIEKILKATDEKKDYESRMPNKLKALKDKFVNDDPKIPNDNFKVGFAINDGGPNYYLIVNNKYQALEISKKMGYKIKQERGGNVFEIDTDGKKMTGNKLDKITEDINMIDEVKDVRNGISNVNINYNNKYFDNRDENYQKIEKFIEDNRDPSTMAVIQADIPVVNEQQRIVSLASSDGTRETIVFNNGYEFDKVLPKIVNTYASGKETSIVQENVTIVDYGNNKSSFDVLSSDNTYLRLNNFDTKIVNEVKNTISTYVLAEDKINISNFEKNNTYIKTIGNHAKTNFNKESANTSFLTLLVFTLILVLGIIIVYVIYGG